MSTMNLTNTIFHPASKEKEIQLFQRSSNDDERSLILVRRRVDVLMLSPIFNSFPERDNTIVELKDQLARTVLQDLTFGYVEQVDRV